MRRHFPFLTLILIIFCGNLLAQQISGGGSARHIALGGGPINPYLRDIARVHTNPAQLAVDSNIIWGDLGYLAADVPNGGSRSQFFGGAIALSDAFHVGAILNKRESPLYTIDPSAPPLDPITEMNTYVSGVLGFGAQQFSRPLSPIEIVGAYKSGTLDVGASVSYGRWSNERNAGTVLTQNARTLRIKLGASGPRILKALSLDIAVVVGLNSASAKYESSGQTSELSMEDGTEYGTDVRGEYAIDDRWTLVPRLRWYSNGWGMNQVKNGVPAVPNPGSSYGHDEVEFGIGAVFQKDDILIVGGLSYQQTELKSDYRSSLPLTTTTVTTTDLPKINLGAEIRLASWAAARIGYFDRLASVETVTGTSSGKTTSTVSTELPWYGDPNGLSAAQQRLTVGVGINTSGFCFDATVGEGYFLNGPWPLSGTAQQMFGVISMSFHF